MRGVDLRIARHRASDAAVAKGPAAQAVSVQFERGLLTVQARGVPLRDVLAAISRTVDVSFTLGDDAAEPVTVSAGPRPTRDTISRLLDGASYGYAYLDAMRGDARPGTARVFLFKRGKPGETRGSAATRAVVMGTDMPADIPAPARDEALRQQRATDALFDACKAEACDTS